MSMPMYLAGNTQNILQIQHKHVKNLNWWEAADQMAIYKRGQRTETQDYCVTNPVSDQGRN